MTLEPPEFMPIVTEFSARFVAAGRNEIDPNDQQRKMS